MVQSQLKSAEALEALAWHIAAGADEAIGDVPTLAKWGQQDSGLKIQGLAETDKTQSSPPIPRVEIKKPNPEPRTLLALPPPPSPLCGKNYRNLRAALFGTPR
jgi:hypothetical protein